MHRNYCVGITFNYLKTKILLTSRLYPALLHPLLIWKRLWVSARPHFYNSIIFVRSAVGKLICCIFLRYIRWTAAGWRSHRNKADKRISQKHRSCYIRYRFRWFSTWHLGKQKQCKSGNCVWILCELNQQIEFMLRFRLLFCNVKTTYSMLSISVARPKKTIFLNSSSQRSFKQTALLYLKCLSVSISADQGIYNCHIPGAYWLAVLRPSDSLIRTKRLLFQRRPYQQIQFMLHEMKTSFYTLKVMNKDDAQLQQACCERHS